MVLVKLGPLLALVAISGCFMGGLHASGLVQFMVAGPACLFGIVVSLLISCVFQQEARANAPRSNEHVGLLATMTALGVSLLYPCVITLL